MTGLPRLVAPGFFGDLLLNPLLMAEDKIPGVRDCAAAGKGHSGGGWACNAQDVTASADISAKVDGDVAAAGVEGPDE